jgi:hypothetical protein
MNEAAKYAMQNNPSLTQEQAMAQVKDYFNTKNS